MCDVDCWLQLIVKSQLATVSMDTNARNRWRITPPALHEGRVRLAAGVRPPSCPRRDRHGSVLFQSLLHAPVYLYVAVPEVSASVIIGTGHCVQHRSGVYNQESGLYDIYRTQAQQHTRRHDMASTCIVHADKTP